MYLYMSLVTTNYASIAKKLILAYSLTFEVLFLIAGLPQTALGVLL